MNKYLPFVFLFLSLSCITAQETALPDIKDLLKTPDSPEVTAFMKYGTYTANLYTGTPSIAIPIHTIRGKEVSLPISLTYDASGIKVSQLATSTGLGWNLNYGGVVQRQVNGFPDKSSKSGVAYKEVYSNDVRSLKDIINNNGTNNPDNLELYNFQGSFSTLSHKNIVKNGLEDYIDGTLDFEADMFSFSINGLSGTIFIDYSQPEGSGYKVFCVDQPNIKVSYVGVGADIFQWIITDENGTVYTFSDAEYTLKDYLGHNFEYEYEFKSAWYISSIVSANGLDTIEFNYSIPTYWQSRREALSTIIEHRYSDGCENSGTGTDHTDLGDGEGEVDVIYIEDEEQESRSVSVSAITLPNSDSFYKIKQFHLNNITYNGDQVVVLVNGMGRLDLPSKAKTDKIRIKDPLSGTLKEYDFSYSYFSTTSAESNNGSDWFEVDETPPSNYGERYNKRLRLDSLTISPENGLVTDNQVYNFEYFSGNLPSTDSSSQDYWGYFNGSSNNTMVAGHRGLNSGNSLLTFYGLTFSGTDRDRNLEKTKVGTLSKITYPTGGYSEFHYDLHSDDIYGKKAGGLRVSKIVEKPDDASIAVTKNYDYGTAIVSQRLEFSKVFTETKPVSGAACSGVRRTYKKLQRYSYNIAPSVKVPIYYNSASESLFDSATNESLGKTTYTYLGASYGALSGTYTDVAASQPTKIEVWDAQNNLLEETTNHYDIITYPMPERKLRLTRGTTIFSVCRFQTGVNYAAPFRLFYAEKNSPLACTSGDNTLFGSELPSYTDYSINKYTRYSYRVRLDSIIKKSNYPTPLTSLTTYHYNNKDHNKPHTTKVYLSDGGIKETRVLYSGDYNLATAPDPIDDLNIKHRIAVPIEVESYKDNVLLSTLKWHYRWVGSFILPDKIETSKNNDALEERIIYSSYDAHGNIQEIYKKDGTPIYSIWGYNGTLLIAKIENFEGSQISNDLQLLIDEIIVLSNDEDTAIKEAHLLSKLNEMRNHNDTVNATVSTFTYNPGIGVTSITDPRGRTQYFEYDTSNRLKQVKDNEGNILSNNNYHYKTQN